MHFVWTSVFKLFKTFSLSLSLSVSDPILIGFEKSLDKFLGPSVSYTNLILDNWNVRCSSRTYSSHMCIPLQS